MLDIQSVQYRTPDQTSFVVTQADGTVCYVPADPRNADHQQVLAWVASGNSPLPAN